MSLLEVTADHRLECLRMAIGRHPNAPMAEIFREARKLLAFVAGWDDIVTVDGQEVIGRRL